MTNTGGICGTLDKWLRFGGLAAPTPRTKVGILDQVMISQEALSLFKKLAAPPPLACPSSCGNPVGLTPLSPPPLSVTEATALFRIHLPQLDTKPLLCPCEPLPPEAGKRLLLPGTPAPLSCQHPPTPGLDLLTPGSWGIKTSDCVSLN